MRTREDYAYASHQATEWARMAKESAGYADRMLAEAHKADATAKAAWALYYSCSRSADSDKWVAEDLAKDLAAERAFYGEV